MTHSHLIIKGAVQGVGFRPFIFRIANKHKITGSVTNTDAGVVIQAFGNPTDLSKFIRAISEQAPPLARIRSVDRTDTASAPKNVPGRFEILDSQSTAVRSIEITRDSATCENCIRELFDPNDRRYLHPFINCTDCGPRYTIIRGLPYDRPKTTMADFEMCEDCAREYQNPSDRRFHAQPVCCPKCGPRFTLLDSHGKAIPSDNPVQDAALHIRQGRIAAVKGIGGFHLACRADSDEFVQRLRQRKNREEKPFALMLPDLDTTRQIATLSDAEQRMLCGPEHPIVLARKKDHHSISRYTAPDVANYGIMLAYTPVHHLLFHYSELPVLIMTSGNQTDAPIRITNQEALETLDAIADVFLVNDRDIHVRNDDSITRVIGGESMIIRRARGFVPEPVPSPVDITGIVGCGPLLNSTVTIGRGRDACVSQYLGTVNTIKSMNHLRTTLDNLLRLLDVAPEIYAADMHPDYLSTALALNSGKEVVRVQHHHAHASACMAENHLEDKCICVLYDGTGLGEDHTSWGGEIFIADYTRYERKARLSLSRLPGGDQAVYNPGRMAIGALYPLLGRYAAHACPWMAEEEKTIILQMLASDTNCPLTSSAGRMFDALSAMLDVCRKRTYEGQPAIEVEGAAKPDETSEYKIQLNPKAELLEIDSTSILLSCMNDLEQNVSADIISARFHNTLARATAEAANTISVQSGITTVCLSGGCFQNRLLTERLVSLLGEKNLTPILHRAVPPNDECISYGQAVIAGTKRASGITD